MQNDGKVRTVKQWREDVFFMNQDEFADLIRVNVSTLSLWENNKRQPRPRTKRVIAERMSKRLGFDISPLQISWSANAPVDDESPKAEATAA